MVIDPVKLKNKHSTMRSGMRGRDAARELTLKVNILQVPTIGFSESESIVNLNSKLAGPSERWKEMDELEKQKTHVPSLSRGIQKISRTMASHLEQVRQERSYATSTRFSSCSLSQKPSSS